LSFDVTFVFPKLGGRTSTSEIRRDGRDQISILEQSVADQSLAGLRI